MSSPTRLPMFPLGTVLFPGLAMPLHVFEPRYRVLVHDCLTGTPEFGVVLIERGSEVGGGDSRFDVGTRARIVEARELPDGRWVLAVVGVARVRVASWLADDPYPLAEVVELVDEPPVGAIAPRREEFERALRRLLALRAELGLPAEPATVELAGDDAVAAAQAVLLAGIGPLDAQRVLATDGLDARLALVGELLTDELEVLARRAQGG
jgi:Lon protease-like protein